MFIIVKKNNNKNKSQVTHHVLGINRGRKRLTLGGLGGGLLDYFCDTNKRYVDSDKCEKVGVFF